MANIARWVRIIPWRLAAALLWMAVGSVWAQVPVLDLSAQPGARLSGAMSLTVVRDDVAASADDLWRLGATDTTAWPSGRWLVRPGARVVGRAVLQAGPQPSVHVVQVPISRIDHVQVWWREPGGTWNTAHAGDRIPYSHWPYRGQMPSFPLAIGSAPLELMVAVANEAAIDVPVLIKPDAQHRADDVLQANTLGLIMGLGIMGAVVCLVSALTFRGRASWVLVAYAAWTFVMVAAVSGYAGLWLTPDWPEFNDGAKHFAGVVMAGLLVAVTVEMLDQIDIWRPLRWAGVAVLGLTLAYAIAQALWLPNSWRPVGGVAWVAFCMLASLALCVLSYLRGGRHVELVAAAVVCFGLVGVLAAAIALGAAPSGRLGIDWRSILSALLLFASAQFLRHALYRRERYGRDVLGRAAIGMHRDPLTALLSYPGAQSAYEQAGLRHRAGRSPVAVMLITLPALEQCSTDHGFVLTERALVRFAAALQQVLGREWAIGRLSKSRFCAMANNGNGATALGQTATRVLSHCARVTEPLPVVSEFDLRIVCAFSDGELPFADLLRGMDDAADAMAPGKRITAV
jgi:GGDEF domain-containing protein